jgi:hypothetical protein
MVLLLNYVVPHVFPRRSVTQRRRITCGIFFLLGIIWQILEICVAKIWSRMENVHYYPTDNPYDIVRILGGTGPKAFAFEISIDVISTGFILLGIGYAIASFRRAPSKAGLKAKGDTGNEGNLVKK